MQDPYFKTFCFQSRVRFCMKEQMAKRKRKRKSPVLAYSSPTSPFECIISIFKGSILSICTSYFSPIYTLYLHFLFQLFRARIIQPDQEKTHLRMISGFHRSNQLKVKDGAVFPITIVPLQFVFRNILFLIQRQHQHFLLSKFQCDQPAAIINSLVEQQLYTLKSTRCTLPQTF